MARKRLSKFIVGFLKLSVSNGLEVPQPAGSGTLVKYRGHRGVLTAAHVLSELPTSGEVGIVRFDERFRQRTKIEMSDTHRVTEGPGHAEEEGPDLAFLYLSAEVAGSLEASSEFFDFDRHETQILQHSPGTSPGFDAVVGVIAEMTQTDRSLGTSWFRGKRRSGLSFAACDPRRL